MSLALLELNKRKEWLSGRLENLNVDGLVVASGVVFSSPGAVSPSILNYYEEYSQVLNTNWSGSATTPFTLFPTLKIIRIGKTVNMTLTPMQFTGTNIGTEITCNDAIPARFLPASMGTTSITGVYATVPGLETLTLNYLSPIRIVKNNNGLGNIILRKDAYNVNAFYAVLQYNYGFISLSWELN